MRQGSAKPGAVFLDRDGVINELVEQRRGVFESPLRPEDVHLTDGAAQHLEALRRIGFVVLYVSNQPAAAKGIVPVAQIEEVHHRVLDELARAGSRFDGGRLCLHHPSGVVAELTDECQCRKPAPGMLLALAKEFRIDPSRSWMVGDTDADVQAGAAAGVRTILVLTPGSAHKRGGVAEPKFTVPDLGGAVRAILGDTYRGSSQAEVQRVGDR